MKQTTQSTGLTSFHGSTVKATVNEMKEVLGNVMYYGLKMIRYNMSGKWKMKMDMCLQFMIGKNTDNTQMMM
jgi:hypothetical protein